MQVPEVCGIISFVWEDYTDHPVCVVFWECLGVGSTGAFSIILLMLTKCSSPFNYSADQRCRSSDRYKFRRKPADRTDRSSELHLLRNGTRWYVALQDRRSSIPGRLHRNRSCFWWSNPSGGWTAIQFPRSSPEHRCSHGLWACCASNSNLSTDRYSLRSIHLALRVVLLQLKYQCVCKDKRIFDIMFPGEGTDNTFYSIWVHDYHILLSWLIKRLFFIHPVFFRSKFLFSCYLGHS